MKRLFVAVFLLGPLAFFAVAQPPLRVVTRPKIPSQDAIDRLGLAFHWHSRVELDSARDGIYSVQIIPRGTGEAIKTEILVQTLSGSVYLFDGESGALRWSTAISFRYTTLQPAAYNTSSIIVTRSNWFFVLNRDTGIQRVYKKSNGERIYGYLLDNMPSAGPAANDAMVAFASPDRVVTFLLPDFELAAAARERDATASQDREGSLQPTPDWTYYDPTMKLNVPPVITPSQITVTTADGRVVSLAFGLGRRLRYEFRTLAPLTAPIGHRGDFGYVGAEDYNLYALNLAREQVLWRFAAGAPILRRPEVTDADVFVTAKDRGMFRLNRIELDTYWLEPSAERLLAAHYHKDANGKFKLDGRGRVLAKYVYAADRHGKMLVLDGDRGGVLAQFDTSAWQIPISNEWTDRIYFANNDGQIMCLRPRDSLRPQINKSIDPPRRIAVDRPAADRPAPPADPVPSPPKDDEKKDKKDDKKEAALDVPSSLRAEAGPAISAPPRDVAIGRIMMARRAGL